MIIEKIENYIKKRIEERIEEHFQRTISYHNQKIIELRSDLTSYGEKLKSITKSQAKEYDNLIERYKLELDSKSKEFIEFQLFIEKESRNAIKEAIKEIKSSKVVSDSFDEEDTNDEKMEDIINTDNELNHNEQSVLEIIREEGYTSLSKIGAKVGLSRTWVSKILQKLEEQDLVQKTENGYDIISDQNNNIVNNENL